MGQIVLLYIILLLISGVYFFWNVKKKKSFDMFSWYLLGQALFFSIPYIVVTILNLDFKYYQSDEIVLLGWLLIITSNVLVFLSYKVFPIYLPKVISKSNSNFNKAALFIIYGLVVFSFLFALFNIIDIGISNISANHVLRQRLSILGPFAIILMLPLGVSTYYWIRIIDGEKTSFIKYKALIFSIMALIVSFFRGQRTDLILLFLFPLLYIFYKKRKLGLLIGSFVGLIVFSAAYATLFKTSIQYLDLGLSDVILRVITGDIDRNWTYWMAIDQSRVTSNSIMSIPFGGYIYTILTFIPRSIFEFKGYSTETWFVFFMGNNFESDWFVSSLSDVNWGITLGGITESIINGGYIGIILFSIIMGYMLKVMQYLTIKYKYLNCCIPLIAILFSGYTFFNILIIYIPIAFVLFVFNKRDCSKINSKVVS
ncbi:hypothetical protein JOD29_003531 [Lysinibacillus composti]|uniref:O-antigen polysaccharide polymerase Wzy n=1 Tax=Lysinibacillus composti TaxID=720633 RepID=UPI00131518F7|nr:O-antigen polysaccharide polymerase Wzy [Lysinibacillus composti]MBM7610252.1 hypothetical protein [Lysinibacillus composti]